MSTLIDIWREAYDSTAECRCGWTLTSGYHMTVQAKARWHLYDDHARMIRRHRPEDLIQQW